MDHGTPAEGMECACCYDDIEGGKGGNYVEYRTGEGKKWLPSLFCKGCIQVLIKRQWPIYEEGLAKATCKAQQKRMLGAGPPTHVNDKTGLKCEEGESVHSLWYVGDDDGEPQIQSALLEGAPQGEARQIWWDEKLAFQFDEDDEEEEGKPAAAAADTATASTPPPVPGTASPPPVPPVPAAPADAATATAAVQPPSGAKGTVAVAADSPIAEQQAGGVAAVVGEGAAADAATEMVVDEEPDSAAAPPVADASAAAAAAPAASPVPLA